MPTPPCNKPPQKDDLPPSFTRRAFLQSGAAAAASVCLDAALSSYSIAHDSSDPPVPAWVQKVTRMTFGGPDAVALAAQVGAEVLHTNVIWPYFPLRKDGGGLSLDDDKRLKQLVADGKKHSVRIVLGLPPFPSVELVRKHPEWRVHSDRSDSILKLEPREDNLGTRLGCNVGPWGNYLIEICAELVRDYRLDGFSFDGNYQSAICYCKACTDAYRKETGRDIPDRVNLDDIPYREYLVWRGNKLDDHYRLLRRRIQAENADAAIITWAVNAGRYGHLLTSPRATATTLNHVIDMPMQEWWGDETNLGASVAPAFGAAYLKCVAGDRPAASEPYLMSRGNPYGTDSFPAHERLTRTLLALSHGCIAAESLGWPGHIESARQSLAAAGNLAPWLAGCRPLPWAGMLVSEQTRQFYAYKNITENFLPHVFGGFRAASEEHLPFALLNDWDLHWDRLSQFAVLVLPNAAALSDLQVSQIRKFVEGGGGLVATGETSICDELGRPRGDFALADLFGVHYEGRPEAPVVRANLDPNFAIAIDDNYWSQRVGLATLNWDENIPLASAPLGSLVPTRSVNFRGPRVKVSEPENPAEVVLRMRPDGSDSPPIPAAIARKHGRGRVVYFAAAVEAGLWSYGYPYQRCLFANAIRWAASRPEPMTLDAPMCVQLTAFVQPAGAAMRLVIHLFNGVNTTAHHGLTAMDVPLREETIPIHGIRLSLPANEWHDFHLEPIRKAMKPKEIAGMLVFELPPLERHLVLVGEDR